MSPILRLFFLDSKHVKLLLGIAALLSSGPVSGACPSPVRMETLAATILDAESSYGDLEIDSFTASTVKMRDELRCLDRVIPSAAAASIHRIEGLLAFTTRDSVRASMAFAAARSIEPSYVFPEGIVPARNLALQDYVAFDLRQGQTQAIPPPASGRIYFDGTPSLNLPRSWPTILQRVDQAGTLLETTYLWPSQTLPDHPARTKEPLPSKTLTASADGPFGPRFARHPRWGLLGASAALALAAATVDILSYRSWDAYQTTTDYADLGPLRQKTNSLFWIATGLGAGSVGFGVAGVVEWR